MVVSCLSNVGPGVGMIGADRNFGMLTSVTKFLLTWVMLLGRLEIFVVLTVLSPRDSGVLIHRINYIFLKK